METLPVITPQPSAVPAAAGAQGAAAPDEAASTAQDGDFQTLLTRSLAGLARGAKSAPAAPANALGEDVAADAEGDEDAQAVPTATDAALALLAALPQAAARPDVAAGAPAGDGVAGAEHALAPRAWEAAAADGKPARPGKGEPGLALTADPDTNAERLPHGADPLPEFRPADAPQGAHAPLHAAHAPAAPYRADPAAAGPAAPRIETPLGAPGWSTALADRVMMFLGDKQQVAELHINPPHLGPVEITLSVSDDRASAVFVSPHAAVRETIESALPRLREVLAESGINLGQASVTADSPRDGSGEAQPRPSFAGGDRAATSTPAGASALAAARRARGMVDLFA